MKFKSLLASALIALLFISNSFAAGPSYPSTTPVYIPSAVGTTETYSAPAVYTYKVSGISAVSLRVSGTCTSLAATLQGSNDNVNWTDLPIATVASGIPASSISAPGFWRGTTSGLSYARVNITALAASCTVTMVGTQAPVMSFNTPVSGDPCLNSALPKTTVAINQAASLTAALAPTVANTSIYVCSVSVSAVGTNPTFTFRTGTQASTACDTGGANATGAFNPSATVGTALIVGTGTVIATPVGSQLCLLTAATTSVQGVLSFVRQ